MSKRLKTNLIDYTDVYCIIVRSIAVWDEQPEPLFVCKKSNNVFRQHFQRYVLSIFQTTPLSGFDRIGYFKKHFYLNFIPNCGTECEINCFIDKISATARLDVESLNIRIEKNRAICAVGQGPTNGRIHQRVMPGKNSQWPHFKFEYDSKENTHKITVNCYWSMDEYMKSD